MTRYCVIGGNGKVSRLFTEQAVSRGISVTSIIRSESQVDSIKEIGATPVVESIEEADESRLAEIFRGHHAVVWSAGAGGKGGPERTRKVDYEAAIKTYNACEKAEIKRFISVSAIDARDRSKAVPSHYTSKDVETSEMAWKAIPVYMQAKFEADRELVRLNPSFNWTLLRPTRLTDEKGTGKIQLGNAHFGSISREDVATTLLELVGRNDVDRITLDLSSGDMPIVEAVENAITNKLNDTFC